MLLDHALIGDLHVYATCQVQLRLSNEKYLRSKPEVRALTAAFMHKVLEEKPDNVLVFAHQFFTQDGLADVARHK